MGGKSGSLRLLSIDRDQSERYKHLPVDPSAIGYSWLPNRQGHNGATHGVHCTSYNDARRGQARVKRTVRKLSAGWQAI
jgi:hypothetical protein